MSAVDGGLTPPSHAELQAAVQWYLALNDDQVTAAQYSAWQAWLGANPQHALAWGRIEKLQGQLRGVPTNVALPVLTQLGLQRRQALKLLMLLGAGALTYGGYQQSRYSVDYATGTGERTAQLLADGTQLLLNTNTRVDVLYSASERLIILRQGQLSVTTASDGAKARPLWVSTAHGRMRALGTRFDVRVEGALSTVSVQSHAVEVHLAHGALAPKRVDAGRTLSFFTDRFGAVQAAATGTDAWTQGKLVVIEWRLAEFVTELARYRPGFLSCAPQVAELRVTGAFMLDDTDAILANLEVSLGVKVRSFSRYWVLIEA